MLSRDSASDPNGTPNRTSKTESHERTNERTNGETTSDGDQLTGPNACAHTAIEQPGAGIDPTSEYREAREGVRP